MISVDREVEPYFQDAERHSARRIEMKNRSFTFFCIQDARKAFSHRQSCLLDLPLTFISDLFSTCPQTCGTTINNKQQRANNKQQTTNPLGSSFSMNHFPSQSICAIAFTLSLANQRSAAESRKEPAILRDPVVFDLETGCYSMQLHPNTTRSYISYCPIRVSTDHQPPFFRTKISSARKYTPRPVVHQARLNIHVARDCVFGWLGMRLFLGLGPGGLTFPPTPLLQGRGGAILTL